MVLKEVVRFVLKDNLSLSGIQSASIIPYLGKVLRYVEVAQFWRFLDSTAYVDPYYYFCTSALPYCTSVVSSVGPLEGVLHLA